MVMSMNSYGGGYGSYGGYGNYGGTSFGGGNVPSQLKAKYGYEFDFRERPKVNPKPLYLTPVAHNKPTACSRFVEFLTKYIV